MTAVPVAVLVSGSGTNLQALLDASGAGRMPAAHIQLVISDRPGAYALKRAEVYGVQTLCVDMRSLGREAAEQRMLDALEKHGIRLVVLAGFLSILSPGFIAHYRGRMLNVHPSLLPAFGGMGMYGLRVHQAALKRGVKLTGATVHLVNEEPDGGPILMQQAVAVEEGDTPETLQQRVMRQAEWVLLPQAVQQLSEQLMKEAKHANG